MAVSRKDRRRTAFAENRATRQARDSTLQRRQLCSNSSRTVPALVRAKRFQTLPANTAVRRRTSALTNVASRPCGLVWGIKAAKQNCNREFCHEPNAGESRRRDSALLLAG